MNQGEPGGVSSELKDKRRLNKDAMILETSPWSCHPLCPGLDTKRPDGAYGGWVGAETQGRGLQMAPVRANAVT